MLLAPYQKFIHVISLEQAMYLYHNQPAYQSNNVTVLVMSPNNPLAPWSGECNDMSPAQWIKDEYPIPELRTTSKHINNKG